MNDTRSEIREKLKILAKELKAQKIPDSTISTEIAQFSASALERCLEGKVKSLDVAFGLTSKRGGAGSPKYRKDCVKKIFKMQLETY